MRTYHHRLLLAMLALSPSVTTRSVAMARPVTPIVKPSAQRTGCAQAPQATARTVQIASYQFKGAGGFQDSTGVTFVVWTGADCSAWIRFRGAVIPSRDERTVQVTGNALFAAYEALPGGVRSYTATATSQLVNDGVSERAPNAADSVWIATMIVEFVRRTGWNAELRAAGLLGSKGLSALLSETALVPDAAVRSRYLTVAALNFPTDSNRAQFVERATAMLEHAHPSIRFLASLPAPWRRDPAVLQAVYTEMASTHETASLEQMLSQFLPPTPLPVELRAPLLRVISAMPAIESRQAWSTRLQLASR